MTTTKSKQRSVEAVVTFRFTVPEDATEAPPDLIELYDYIERRYGVERQPQTSRTSWWVTKETERVGRQVVLSVDYKRPR